MLCCVLLFFMVSYMVWRDFDHFRRKFSVSQSNPHSGLDRRSATHSLLGSPSVHRITSFCDNLAAVASVGKYDQCN